MHEIERLYRLSHKSSAQSALLSPPDVFAVCCYFAKISGCYRAYSHSSEALDEQTKHAVADGKAWRRVLDRAIRPKPDQIPGRVRAAWRQLGSKIKAPLQELSGDPVIVASCLYLVAACDEACKGVGIPAGAEPSGSYFELQCEGRIGAGTLCRSIPSDAVRVLPKQHTPQAGFNIRSLTHYLALCAASEVEPVWTQTPGDFSYGNSYNVLLAPWPLTLEASAIRPAAHSASEYEKPGYFDFEPRRASAVSPVRDWTQKLLAAAKAMGQSIDLVVFPECSLTEPQWRAVSSTAAKFGASVVAGVRQRAKDSGYATNSLKFKLSFKWQGEAVQQKHHRWKVDAAQIINYGLGGTLDHRRQWWENIEIEQRKLHFFAVRKELVICPLICEDLARQDPVAELVRAVGPNLVIALLMDGPQLSSRWSARYASVLADDPGSSVLTISSLGMVGLSRPRDQEPSRVFASWKDSSSQFVPLKLGQAETALILNLQFQSRDEIGVDGRKSAARSASTPVLCGIHPLGIPAEASNGL